VWEGEDSVLFALFANGVFRYFHVTVTVRRLRQINGDGDGGVKTDDLAATISFYRSTKS